MLAKVSNVAVHKQLTDCITMKLRPYAPLLMFKVINVLITLVSFSFTTWNQTNLVLLAANMRMIDNPIRQILSLLALLSLVS